MSKRFMPELLSPAGSINALKAAARAGADAVYLASQKFGARHYAENFNPSELEEALNLSELELDKKLQSYNYLIRMN